ncbi:hypothetical protein [Nonomuraea basaltis]|uniref:hypothetical protein n=1 Tax=Nonomuraea basaltis TaxID=2495887 RepID=UPI00110C4698|nr:hypothetical protein [Nonomuraea basaltis]TMR99553.1 hypothetical protein EJK15_07000 [Nonomuraea basaltis]
MRDLLLYVLAAAGAITVSAAAALVLYGWWLHRRHQQAARLRRDERARALRPEQVNGQEGLAAWHDYIVDHDLHTVDIPKEWK